MCLRSHVPVRVLASGGGDDLVSLESPGVASTCGQPSSDIVKAHIQGLSGRNRPWAWALAGRNQRGGKPSQAWASGRASFALSSPLGEKPTWLLGSPPAGSIMVAACPRVGGHLARATVKAQSDLPASTDPTQKTTCTHSLEQSPPSPTCPVSKAL